MYPDVVGSYPIPRILVSLNPFFLHLWHQKKVVMTRLRFVLLLSAPLAQYVGNLDA